MRTPITLISGPLGSGKTTLLRRILASVQKRIAILMNEFGEIAIDSKVVQGKNVSIAELAGGCVCCSLQGEFEAAVREVIETVDPDIIVVETTGVAEPEALIFDIQESLPQARLDGVVTVADADAMIRYPSLGHTTRLQLEDADTILLNKTDLVLPAELEFLEEKLHLLNGAASIIPTERCLVDPDLLFGIMREKVVRKPSHHHQPEYESSSYSTCSSLDRGCFEQFVDRLSAKNIYRAKGFVRFAEGTFLFNFVAGRWDLEPFEGEETTLVFIGKSIKSLEWEIAKELRRCEGNR